jgi:hypothetical protein
MFGRGVFTLGYAVVNYTMPMVAVMAVAMVFLFFAMLENDSVGLAVGITAGATAGVSCVNLWFRRGTTAIVIVILFEEAECVIACTCAFVSRTRHGLGSYLYSYPPVSVVVDSRSIGVVSVDDAQPTG